MKLLAVALVSLMLAGCGSPDPKQQAETATAGACITSLKLQLNDPDSLEWDYSTTKYVHTDEGVTLNRVFTASNAYGGRVRNMLQCTYNPEAKKIVAIDIF